MKKQVGTALGACLVAAMVMTGCGKSDKAAAEAPAAKQTAKAQNPYAEMFGGWDAAAELEAIQGTYNVKDVFGAKPSSWTVDGNKATIVRGDKTIEAELDLTIPGSITVKESIAGGGYEKSELSYARNGKDVYIGLGTAGMKVGDLYIVEKDGAVVFDGTSCKFYRAKPFGKGFDAPVAVKGSVSGEGDNAVFSFELPNKYKPEEMKSFSVNVIGTALVNSQAKGNLVTL